MLTRAPPRLGVSPANAPTGVATRQNAPSPIVRADVLIMCSSLSDVGCQRSEVRLLSSDIRHLSSVICHLSPHLAARYPVAGPQLAQLGPHLAAGLDRSEERR